MDLSLGDSLSDAGITKWMTALGVTSAPVPRRNVGEAVGFFARQMPHLKPEMALNFLRAMDLSKSVQAIILPPGERLIAFRLATESPFKLFFARSGASPFRSGIDPTGRSAIHFVSRAPVPALESFTSGANDTWTGNGGPAIAPRAGTYGVLATGGGLQLLIPESYSRLLLQTP